MEQLFPNIKNESVPVGGIHPRVQRLLREAGLTIDYYQDDIGGHSLAFKKHEPTMPVGPTSLEKGPLPAKLRDSPAFMEVMGLVVASGAHTSATGSTWKTVWNPAKSFCERFPLLLPPMPLTKSWAESSDADRAAWKISVYRQYKIVPDVGMREDGGVDVEAPSSLGVQPNWDALLPFDKVSFSQTSYSFSLLSMFFDLRHILSDRLKVTYGVSMDLVRDNNAAVFEYHNPSGKYIRMFVSDIKTWDLRKPTKELTSELPPILENPEVCTLLALLGEVMEIPDLPCYFVYGPTPSQRREMWVTEETAMSTPEQDLARRRLVEHLVTIPGVLVDMSKEPMMPWKGMKFFHGTDYEDLQVQELESDVPRPERTAAFMEGDVVEMIATGGRSVVHSVLSPTMVMLASVGMRIPTPDGLFGSSTGLLKVVTYAYYVGQRIESIQSIVVEVDNKKRILQLSSDNGYRFPLRMDQLDAQNGPSKAKIPVSDCNLTWKTISGDQHLTAFTTPYFTKALNYGPKIYTYRLKKEGRDLKLVDLRHDYTFPNEKTALNPFRAVSELSGIPYIKTRDRVAQARRLFMLFRDTEVDGAILNTDIEWIWFNPKEALQWDGPGELDSLTDNLLDASKTGSRRDKNMLVMTLEQIDGDLVDDVSVARMLSGCPFSIQRVSNISHLRWELDQSEKAYANQYLATTASVSSMWRPVEIRDPTKAVKLYEIDYRKLWHILAGGTDRYQDLYMASSITEGACNHLLPYNRLITAIKALVKQGDLPIHLKVTLPTGIVQIVPPLDLPKQDYIDLPRALTRLEMQNKIREASSKGRGPSATLRGEKRSEAPASAPADLQKPKEARLQARMRW